MNSTKKEFSRKRVRATPTSIQSKVTLRVDDYGKQA
jgi:hypothetical protein